MYEQSLALMPEDISADDRQYIANTIKQFSLMAGEALNNEYFKHGQK